jgi:Uma2 family endonuclease
MSTATSQPGASADPVPRLRDGDRLSVPEFLRRYAADPVVVRAELIDGVVYVNRKRVLRDGEEQIVPPISFDGHARPDRLLIVFTGNYEVATPGLSGSTASTLVLPGREDTLEPDSTLFVAHDRGGKARVGNDDYLHGVPELVIEVSHTSGGRDMGQKYEAYRAAGVPEYLVWRTEEQEVLWHALKRKKYVLLSPDARGVIRSEVFPGLWLNVPALLAGNLAEVLATLQLGLASPEHAAFVARLQKAAPKA